ncbi:hypothetical protein FB480_11758 [Agrobacterium vitis]|nr:hypothetical protein FB480_11758 [Agrobacterium vitis]
MIESRMEIVEYDGGAMVVVHAEHEVPDKFLRF